MKTSYVKTKYYVLASISNQMHVHTNTLNFGDSSMYVIWQFWFVVLEKDGEINWTNCVKNEKKIKSLKEERNNLRGMK